MHKIKNVIYIPELRNNMDYPVGNNIMSNLPAITAMAKAIIKYFPPPCSIRIFCRGSSGAIIAGVISPIVKPLEVIYCRKPGENRHFNGGSRRSTTYDTPTYNIIVDDFIFSGETIRSIYHEACSEVGTVHGLVVSGSVSPYAINDLEIDTLISGSQSLTSGPYSYFNNSMRSTYLW